MARKQTYKQNYRVHVRTIDSFSGDTVYRHYDYEVFADSEYDAEKVGLALHKEQQNDGRTIDTVDAFKQAKRKAQ